MSQPDRTLEYRCLNALLSGVERWLPDPLSAERLLNRACRVTGLNDFGDEEFLEPYHLLMRDLRESAQLTPLGRQILSQSVLGFLENRLCLQAQWTASPVSLSQELRQPLYVVGFPRSGTTLLFNLLAQHADARPLHFWEAMQPAPRYRNGRPCRRDGRLAQARQVAWFINRQAPRLKTQHPLVAQEPEESTWLLGNTFMSPAFSMQANVPNYHTWLLDQPKERWKRCYQYYRRTLLSLQGSAMTQHWVLRSPAHLRNLSLFLETLPEARVVLPIRDPVKVVGSCCSLLATVRGLSSPHVDATSFGPLALEGLSAAWEMVAVARQRFPERIAIVRYDDLVQRPATMAMAIYSRFGYRIPANYEVRIAEWLLTHAADRFGAHRYRLEDFGITPDEVREHLSHYTKTAEMALSAA